MEDVYRLLLGDDAPAWRKRPPALDYLALARRALDLLPEADASDIATREGLALARLSTLSKKPHTGLPDDAHVKQTLWLLIGAVAFPYDKARARARLNEASEAVLALTHGVSPREREELRARCGEAAAAMARLLSFAIKQQGG